MDKKSKDPKGKQNDQAAPGSHPKARKALETKLKAAIEEAKIDKGFPVTKLEGDWGWDLAKEVAEQKAKFLSAGNAWGILYDFIRLIFDSLPYDERPSGKLIEILDSEKQKSLISGLLEFYDSFPRKYTLYFRFVGGKNGAWKNLKISKDVELVTVTARHPLLKLKRGWKTENSLVDRILDKKHDGRVFHPGNSVITIKTEGFAKNSTEDSAISSAISRLKCITCLGEMSEVLTYAKNNSPWGGPIRASIFILDDTLGEGILDKVNIPDEMALLLAGYALSKRAKGKGLIDPQLWSFQQIGKLLDASPDDENRTPIVTAAEWAFDSNSSSNETVSFIQLCIALEAILGDDKLKEGITKALADRCAYSLGTTAKNRREFREIFEDLYDHRSKLVHGRRIKLESGAQKSLYVGKWLLKGILRKELGNFTHHKNKMHR
ncbi:MAG: hypothetical protein AB7H97_10915 [Pseudobdellovibrionaceae bacterium]